MVDQIARARVFAAEQIRARRECFAEAAQERGAFI